MKKIYPAIILLALFALLLAACGGDAAPEPTNTPPPDDAPAPAAGGGAASPSNIDLDDPEAFGALDSDYELRLQMSFDGGPDAMGEVVLVQKAIIDSVEMQISVNGSGLADLGGVNSVEMSILGDTLYFFNDVNGCAYLPAANYEDPYNEFVYTSDTMNGEAQYVGTATVNGVATYQYTIEEDNLEPDETDVTTLESGSIYVAQEGGYLVRMLLVGMGTNELIGGDGSVPGQLTYQLDFVPVDSVTIEIPEGCELVEDGAEDSAVNTGDYPAMPDASNISSFGGIFSYETSAAIEDVIDLYKTELAAAGWSLDQEIAAGATALLSFTQGDRLLSVAINQDTSGSGVVSVVIFEE